MPITMKPVGAISKTTVRDKAVTLADRAKRRIVFPLVALLYRPEPPNATIILKDGSRVRGFVSGHGTDMLTGEGETFYVAADEVQFDVQTGYARESIIADEAIDRIEFDG